MSTIVSVENLRKSFKDGVEVLKDISFDVEKGQVLGIIGPSGSGKSTFIKLNLYLFMNFSHFKQ